MYAIRSYYGHETGALLVAGEDMADGAAAQRIVERQIGTTGDAGDLGDALAFQQGYGQFGARAFDHRIDLLCDRPG